MSFTDRDGPMESSLRRRRRVAIAIAVLLVAGSIAAGGAAVVAGRIAKKYYVQVAEVRLNPIDIGKYSAANAALAKPALPRVVFIGDSRVERWTPKPDLPGTEAIWRGVNAETTSQMKYRFGVDALALEPNVVVIQSGINDIVGGIAVGRPREAMDTALANLLDMATAAVNSGSEVYLLTVVRPARPSLLRRPVWSDAIYEFVADMNRRLRESQRNRVHVVDADGVLSGNSRALPDRYSDDTLHFSAEGYAALNERLVEQLRISHAVQ